MLKDKLLTYLGIVGIVGIGVIVSDIYLKESQTNIKPPNYSNIASEQLTTLQETIPDNSEITNQSNNEPTITGVTSSEDTEDEDNNDEQEEDEE